MGHVEGRMGEVEVSNGGNMISAIHGVRERKYARRLIEESVPTPEGANNTQHENTRETHMQ